MRFTIYQESRQGSRRSNQDRTAYCYSTDGLLMVVADGMGGHLHGEIAAQIAVQFMVESFQKQAKPTLKDPFLFLSDTFTNAHNAIVDYAAENKLSETPHTTCVACVIQRNIAYWAHVGDSRLYLFRAKKMLSRTRDHTRVQVMLDQGKIREQDMTSHPERNRVFNCLGAAVGPQVELSIKTPLLSGDTLLLCTDGVWGSLSTDDIINTLLNSSVVYSAPELLDKAEAAGGGDSDNLSLIALTWSDSYRQATSGTVSTQNMKMGGFTTEMNNFRKVEPKPGAVKDLTDEEIERAILEIQNAIQKYSKS